MFLYRNAVDVVDSFCMAFFNNAITRFFRKVNLDAL